jgi:predicted nucleotidyltransferase component of viral defense system
MNTFLKLPADERRLAFQQVEAQMGLQAVSVEKDLWVCWTLQTLFAMPRIGDHLTFKGGTSLSKAWKFIQRFSEDIDLVVDKNVLGFGGDAAPVGLQVKRNAESAWRN